MQLDILQIKKILPHRYPFLLIDKVIDLNIKKGTIIAQKNVSINESFFKGHFPSQPIMPGVLIVESMAQTMGILGMKIRESNKEDFDNERRFILAGMNNVRIRLPVIPGDVLELHSKMGKIKRGVYKGHTDAYVNKKIVSSADFIAAYRKV